MRSDAKRLLVSVLPSLLFGDECLSVEFETYTTFVLGHTLVTRVCLSSRSYHVHLTAYTV